MGFIDDVMKNINQGINDIQNKSQEVMTNISLSNRINTLEGKKTALLINIGQLIYDKYEKGDEVSDELLKDKCKELALIEKDIDAARVELKQQRVEGDAPRSEKAAQQAGYKPTPGFQCPHCGAAANSSKFYCVACGGSLKEAQASGSNGGTSSGNGESGQSID
ncbi:MAG TPA: hypothetical protein V6D22_14855 [Candidatus Obscuribacterales bacterium]